MWPFNKKRSSARGPMPEPPIPPAALAAAPTPIEEPALEPVFILPSELGSPLPMPEEPQVYRIPAENFLGLVAEPAVIAKPQPEPAPIQEKMPDSYYEGYCMRCKKKRVMVIDKVEVTGKRNKLIGLCSACGGKMCKMVGTPAKVSLS